MFNSKREKYIVGIFAELPNIVAVLLVTVTPLGYQLAGEIFNPKFYNTVFEFIIPLEVWLFIFVLHVFLALVAIKKQSLFLALCSTGIMIGGYLLTFFLLIFLGFPNIQSIG